MDKLVYIKESKTQTKNGRSWLQVIDQDGIGWNIFNQTAPLETGKSYLFTFEKNDKGYNDIKTIKPLVNIFQQRAMKEVANRSDIKRDISITTSYAIQLVTAGKINIDELFLWSDKIYAYTQEKTDKLILKEPE